MVCEFSLVKNQQWELNTATKQLPQSLHAYGSEYFVGRFAAVLSSHCWFLTKENSQTIVKDN